MVSFQCVYIIVQNGDFCSISPFVLKYLPHPVIENGHSTLTMLKPLPKLNALCRLYDPCQTAVRFVKQVCCAGLGWVAVPGLCGGAESVVFSVGLPPGASAGQCQGDRGQTPPVHSGCPDSNPMKW